MDPTRFDQLVKTATAANPASRRNIVRLLCAGLLVGKPALPVAVGDAQKKKPKGCAGGKKRCGGKCVNLDKSQQNCGKCGKDCSGGKLCCDGKCKDLVTDRFNCGRCGNFCLEDEDCVNGDCQKCSPPQTRCRPTLAASYCADLSSDPKNCGRCFNACRDNEVCKLGGGATGVACICEGPECTVPGGAKRCCPEANGVCCSDGKCCPAGGTCTSTGCCPAGMFPCSGRCCPNGSTCGGNCGSICCSA